VAYRETVGDNLHRSDNELQSGEQEIPSAGDDCNLLCAFVRQKLGLEFIGSHLEIEKRPA